MHLLRGRGPSGNSGSGNGFFVGASVHERTTNTCRTPRHTHPQRLMYHASASSCARVQRRVQLPRISVSNHPTYDMFSFSCYVSPCAQIRLETTTKTQQTREFLFWNKLSLDMPPESKCYKKRFNSTAASVTAFRMPCRLFVIEVLLCFCSCRPKNVLDHVLVTYPSATHGLCVHNLRVVVEAYVKPGTLV